MLAGVLNSDVAVAAGIHVVRAFIRLRQMLLEHKELAAKLRRLDRRVQGHDEIILSLFRAIEGLSASPEPARRRIGFMPDP